MINAPMATARQIGFIHGLASRAGMDEDTRRDFLQRETGRRSCKEITAAEADVVIGKLQASAGAQRVAGLDAPVARKLQALWIAGYGLGLVRDRGDRAMLAFLERQTKVSHTRFLAEPGAAAAAIEALKSWLARDGGVQWPLKEPGQASIALEAYRRAILDAQWLKLVALGAVKPFIANEPLGELPDYAYRVASKQGWDYFERDDYDKVQAALARKLRGALAERDRRQQQQQQAAS